MPSIRIKGNVYSSLEDATPQIQYRPSLPQIIFPADVEPPAIATPISLRRPRSSTVSSRIHAHCTRASRSIPVFDPTDSSQNHPSSPPSRLLPEPSPSLEYARPIETRIAEGRNLDVRRSSLGEPGLVESSLALDIEGASGSNLDLHHHHDDVVEHLDVIDSQVGAFSSLTNAANSIIIPPSSWYSRKPVVILPSSPRRGGDQTSEEFEDSLDRHVDDVLRRPSKVRRTLMGVWSFLKTPMGIITGIYGFLVVFWGAAIVIFLLKIINLHNANQQGFWVEVSSQVETGLFTVTSIGLIPSRVLDTYRVWKIWRYKRRTMQLRAKAGLPQLFDVDDLPDPIYDPNYVHVLTETEQEDLHRQQRKFQYSQTWYRAHGTETHRAFPITTALWICFLNDGNSIFQIFLCGTMWGLNRFQRPAWSTGTLIPASFLCGIAAAILIWRGGEKTKRVEEVKERLRAALSEKSVPKDNQLDQSLRRRSGLHDHQQTFLTSQEKGPTQTLESSSIIEEHMTIPALG